MWNDRDLPIAYLITFRCYGTWLPGDDRGSIDQMHNRYQTPYREPNMDLLEDSRQLLKSKPFTMNAGTRTIVEKAIREVCNHRKWILHAINIRTNHAHTVVSIGEASASKSLNGFKSYSTRSLRKNNVWEFEHSPWARRGSKKHLWNERHLEIAVDYVKNGQGGDLPEFD